MGKPNLKLFTILCITVLISCTKDDGPETNANDLQAVQAQFCNNFQGPAAAYWNMSNGVFLPLPEFPIIKNPGGRITNDQQPLLSLSYPVGYRGFQIIDAQTATLGLDILRNDNAVFFRWVPVSTSFGLTDFDQIIAREINTMFAVLGYDPNNGFEAECRRSVNQPFEGLLVNFNARLLRFGNFTAIVWVRSILVPGLGSVNSAIQIAAAPTAEFDARTLDTFLPFNFQLHVRPDGGGFVDNDGDGSPAHLDPDDNDPNVRGT
ncbi:MAG: hypothetical protein Mars2KO_44710 [Maribacter sp.]|uniref:hypothetical protein n=1 Tax=Maribacter sp. 2307UL18-2 TaxID=3386274 RepID=UPI0039BC22CA